MDEPVVAAVDAPDVATDVEAEPVNPHHSIEHRCFGRPEGDPVVVTVVTGA